MADYTVKKANKPVRATVEVPGSKSITNRALLISALADGKSTLGRVLFSDDSRVFLKALQELGIEVDIDETAQRATVTGGFRQSAFDTLSTKQNTLRTDETLNSHDTLSLSSSPLSKLSFAEWSKGHCSSICVGSAGTAARFLTALLALSDGEYAIDASEQMKKRPMLPLFEALTKLGTEITFTEKEGFLPVNVKGAFYGGRHLKSDTAEVDSDTSTQFLSALLMTAPLIAKRTGKPFYINVTGSRVLGSYVKMTLKVMRDFGIEINSCCKEITPFNNCAPDALHETQGIKTSNRSVKDENISNNKIIFENDTFIITPGTGYESRDYEIEPDVSAACYFYAAAAITGGEVIVRGVHSDSCQGDIRFLELLVQMGCSREETPEGIKITGPADGALHGISTDMKDFSDQTMTLAAIAPFCDSPVEITGIGHIRGQESDRIHAIATELERMGIQVEEGETSLKIYPGTPRPAEIETYNDHRIAMAFSLTGLRCEGIVIKDYECCKKTFENYFEIFDGIV